MASSDEVADCNQLNLACLTQGFHRAHVRSVPAPTRFCSRWNQIHCVGTWRTRARWNSGVIATFFIFPDQAICPKQFSHFHNRPPDSKTDTLLNLDLDLISVIYNVICSLNPDVSVNVKSTWEDDLGMGLPDDKWKHILITGTFFFHLCKAHHSALQDPPQSSLHKCSIG